MKIRGASAEKKPQSKASEGSSAITNAWVVVNQCRHYTFLVSN